MRDGRIITPPTSEGALVGITRDAVIGIAEAMGLDVSERAITLYDCYTCDESFLTGTAAEVIPMVRLDNRRIGDGKPGPITHDIMAAFGRCTGTEGEPIYDA